ncbi:peroxiredoxin Q/BCP [Arthrobacter pigmenti]|uniref:thioredoxin-dependent peroxiredoxin n=1 Tax=Arthrobacter pigmenti TaxID=271432 RepID=A0A846RWC8_9MICC|nr:thioredoxin-dependent thiol peroxidase [Arthrobacter pigmenti]NJC23895.1 peroxiredoxin Q/BCP [Arthrobacter pigmenti]
MSLATGDTAPSFTLPDAYGQPMSLSEFRGRSVVVYFYPKAETPGCTTEACDFRDNLASLQGAGFSVIGISPDTPGELASFSSNHGLPYPLLSDADNAVAKAWGAYGEKQVNGSTVVGIIRSTVVVDPDGNVQQAEYGVDAKGHVSRLREQLGVA